MSEKFPSSLGYGDWFNDPFGKHQQQKLQLQQKQKEQAERISKLFTDAVDEYGPIINDSINKMTPDAAMDALRKIHSRLVPNCRPVDPRYRTEHSRFGSRNQHYFAPEADLKDELFKEYLGSIQNMSDKKERALLAYYAVNNLHYFYDGNGRTARAVYLLIMQEQTLNPEEYLLHKLKGDPRRQGSFEEDNDDETGRYRFIIEQKLVECESINELANILLQEELVKKGTLDRALSNVPISVKSMSEEASSRTFSFLSEEERIEKGMVNIWISDENRAELEEDKLDLYYALSDGLIGNDHCSSLSGLALAVTLGHKGTLKENIEKNMDQYNKLTFIVNYDEYSYDYPKGKYDDRMHSLLDDWKPEDYRLLMKVYRELKREQNEVIMSMFTEDLSFCEGRRIADWAAGSYRTSDLVIPGEQNDSLLARFMKDPFH